MKEWTNDTITVNHKEIPVKLGVMNQVDLLFYPENPRLYSIVCVDDSEPGQEEIQKRLSSMDHVKQLIQSIKANGGITDPLLVKDKENIVIEGNSRLAAYRVLAREDPAKWSMVKCKLLPHNIDDSDIFAILGEYHIIGRKDWAPYEQAGYLYRRHKNQNVAVDHIAEELGISKRKINHLIAVYDFMVTHKENDPNRWSYYDEYLKNQKVRAARADCPQLDKVVVKKIKAGEIEKAVEVRDKLPKIVSVNQKTFNNFLQCKVDFNDSYERAASQGVENHSLQKLNRFREWLYDSDLRKHMKEMPPNQQSKCEFELKKIMQYLKHL